jgi:cathepsin F
MKTKAVILSMLLVAIISQTANKSNATATITATHDDNEAEVLQKFQKYLKDFDRVYTSLDEMTSKYKVFKANYQNVLNLQAIQDPLQKNGTQVGITKFMDTTPEEFKAQYATLKLTAEQLQESEEATKREEAIAAENSAPPTLKDSGVPNLRSGNSIPPVLGAPLSFDWRTQGVVGPVKNQLSCGGCWAFSANVNLEGLYARRFGVYRSFSEEQLIDCDYTNSGCNGGNQQNAFLYVMGTGGLMSSSSYPYQGYQNRCSFSPSYRTPFTVSSWFNAGQNEETIKNYLYTTGPLSVAINSVMLQYYTGGIMTWDAYNCSPYVLDHGVALVGYGTENGLNYWIVRNSWGANWGEGGYFRIARGYGTCGINQYVVSAILA